jgi:hypothetical protein
MKKKVSVSEKKVSATILIPKLDLGFGSRYRNLVYLGIPWKFPITWLLTTSPIDNWWLFDHCLLLEKNRRKTTKNVMSTVYLEAAPPGLTEPKNYTEHLVLTKLLHTHLATKKMDKELPRLWLYRLWIFQGRDTKQERFLVKNQL